MARLLAVGALLVLARLALPTLVRKAVVALGQFPGGAVESLTVAHLGLRSAVFTDVTVRAGDGTMRARAERVQVSAPWRALRQRRVRSITVRGLVLSVQPAPGAAAPAAWSAPAWGVETLWVNASELRLAAGGRVIALPFSAAAWLGDPANPADYTFEIRSRQAGQDLEVSGQASAATRRLRCTVRAAGSSSALASWLSVPAGALGEHAWVVETACDYDAAAPLAACGTLRGRVEPALAPLGAGQTGLTEPLVFSGQWGASRAAEGWWWEGRGEAGGAFGVQSPAGVLAAPNLALRLALKGGPRTGRADLSVEGPALAATGPCLPAGAAVRLSDLGAELSLVAGAAPPAGTGELRIGAVRCGAAELRDLRVELAQAGSALRLDGRARTPVEGLDVEFGGVVRGDRPDEPVRLHVRLPRTTVDRRFELESVAPALRGVGWMGTVEGGAELALSGSRWQGSGRIAMTGATLFLDRLRGEIRGLRAALDLDDLLGVVSRRRNLIAFDECRFGALEIRDGRVDYAVFGPRRFYVQKAVGRWCGGELRLFGLALDLPPTRVEGLLYADAIGMEPLMNFLGYPSVQGSGSFGGKLPFLLEGRRLTIRGGEFQTRVGERGRIRSDLSGFLTRWVPADDARAVYLSITEDALRDFEYAWARLDVEMSGGVLNLGLALSGAPTGRLPYAFDPLRQEFKRVRGGEGNVSFERGIELNLNLNNVAVEAILFDRGLGGLLFKGRTDRQP